MSSAQTVVVTGSTRGIGRGLAVEFLKRGHRVVVTGRSQAAVGEAAAALSAHGEVLGYPCDVRSYAANEALWQAAVARFGRVDMWISNAGVAADRQPFAGIPPDQIATTVETNLVGTMYGTRVALAGMLAQGGGKIYTFEGFGSNDMMSPGLTTYGATKRGLRYFTASVAREYRDSPVLIGALSPGIVITDLLIYSSKGSDAAAWEKAKKLMNILGDRVETVTPWLVEQALANTRQGAIIEWLTRGKAARRFLGAAFGKRDLFAGVSDDAVNVR